MKHKKTAFIKAVFFYALSYCVIKKVRLKVIKQL